MLFINIILQITLSERSNRHEVLISLWIFPFALLLVRVSSINIQHSHSRFQFPVPFKQAGSARCTWMVDRNEQRLLVAKISNRSTTN